MFEGGQWRGREEHNRMDSAQQSNPRWPHRSSSLNWSASPWNPPSQSLVGTWDAKNYGMALTSPPKCTQASDPGRFLQNVKTWRGKYPAFKQLYRAKRTQTRKANVLVWVKMLEAIRQMSRWLVVARWAGGGWQERNRREINVEHYCPPSTHPYCSAETFTATLFQCTAQCNSTVPCSALLRATLGYSL